MFSVSSGLAAILLAVIGIFATLLSPNLGPKATRGLRFGVYLGTLAFVLAVTTSILAFGGMLNDLDRYYFDATVVMMFLTFAALVVAVLALLFWGI